MRREPDVRRGSEPWPRSAHPGAPTLRPLAMVALLLYGAPAVGAGLVRHHAVSARHAADRPAVTAMPDVGGRTAPRPAASAARAPAPLGSDRRRDRDAAPGAGRSTPSTRLFGVILRRNVGVAALLVSGLLTAGTSAAVSLAANGAAHGTLVGEALGGGMSLVTVVGLVAPHAVLELPALLAAGVVGLAGARIAARIARGAPSILADSERRVLRPVALAALGGILAAAALEVTLTPWVADHLATTVHPPRLEAALRVAPGSAHAHH